MRKNSSRAIGSSENRWRLVLVGAVASTFLLALLPYGSAGWTGGSGDWGTWTSTVNPLSAVVGQDYGRLQDYVPIVTHFDGYHANISLLSMWNDKLNWFDISGASSLVFFYSIGGETGQGNILVCVELKRAMEWGGLMNYQEVTAVVRHNVSINNEDGFDARSTQNLVGWETAFLDSNSMEMEFYESAKDNYVEVNAYKINTTAVRFEVLYQRGIGQDHMMLYNCTANMGATWLAAIGEVNKGARHEAYVVGANFTCDETLTVYDDYDWTPSYVEDFTPVRLTPFEWFTRTLYNAASSVLPSGIVNILATFGSYAMVFGNLVGVFLSALTYLIPMAPVLLIFYLIDVGATAVITGSFEPVGAFATSVYSVGSGVVSTLVGVADAVYGFIHFW